MKPQAKVATLTFTGILFLIILLALFSKFILLDSYTTFENRHAREDIQRATLHLDAEITALQKQLRNLVSLDKSLETDQESIPRFIATDLSAEALLSRQISIIAFADNTGRIISGSIFDQEKGTLKPIPQTLKDSLSNPSLINLKQGSKGIYRLPSGPILIATQPVFDNVKGISARGVNILCRSLSDDMLKNFELLTQLNLTILPVNATTLPTDFQIAKGHLLARSGDTTITLSDTEIGGYTLVRDIAGKPAFILRTKTNRDFYQEGIAMIRHFTLWLSLAAILAGGVIIWLLNKVTATRNENLENEKIWQFALEGCGDGVWDWNIQSGEAFFSDRYQEILGYTEPDLKKSMDEWSQRIHPDDYQAATEAIENLCKGDNPCCSFEHRIRCKNGEYRWILIRGKVIRRTADGKPVRITGTITDTTEHRLIEEQVFKSQKLESVGVLAGGIAHDFNNILTAVIGYTSLARMFLHAPDRALKALEQAEKASQRATELTRQLLTFAKGGTPIKQCVSVEDLLRESVSFALRGTNVKENCNITESLYVEADEEQIGLAFSNIALNAIQSMPDGGEITVIAKKVILKENSLHELPAGPFIKITFSDHGCGIYPENLGKIFDPFFSTKTGCTGLGLSTAYSIISKHGGAIDAHSIPGSGTTVILHIPSSENECEQQWVSEETLYANSPNTGHVLVMDDEEMIRDLASELLALIGFQVRTCSSGEEAIEIYMAAQKTDTPFCAAIMDLTIPGGMGGKEAAQAILKIDPNARLIVSSGYSNDPVLAEFAKNGFIAAVSKPYTVDKIMKTMSVIGRGG